MLQRCLILVAVLGAASRLLFAAEPLAPAARPLAPSIVGPWISIASNPDLGDFTSSKQQPVDFCIWQAADGTWQLWSCIRNTECGGMTRLFYRWESDALTSPDWRPMGIAMQADTSLGETAGGLQAPHVVKIGDVLHMFYGDWVNICHATSADGKTFDRVIQPSGRTGMFAEAPGANTRDIMMLDVDGVWHGYYTAIPNKQGVVFMRTTSDFKTWSESTAVAFGGAATTGPWIAECPHVVNRHDHFYLFRTQVYGEGEQSEVYHSADPAMFGINQDARYRLTTLPFAAPEIIHHDGQDYIASLNTGLDGIRIARLKWTPMQETRADGE